MLPETDEEAANPPGFLPPRCGGGRAGVIPSSSGRLWPCCSSLRIKQSGQIPIARVTSALATTSKREYTFNFVERVIPFFLTFLSFYQLN